MRYSRLFRSATPVLVAGLIAATAACAPPVTQPPAGCTTSDLGISGGAPLLGMSDADLTRELDTMWNTGIRWLRFDIDWSAVEATRGQQNWTATDRLVDRARARGLNLLGIVTYAPAWARVAGTSDSHGRPADPATFATFAQQAAQRYNGRVSTWEIWNEPNLVNFFRPAPNVDAYVQLLSAAAQAIRTVQPGATILNGGLAPAVDDGTNIAPTTYVQQLYQRGAQQYFDALSVHPYSWPALPSDASTQSWNTFYRMRFMRDTMVQYGDAATKIWATEFGAPTGTASDAVSTQLQADIIRDGIAEARRLGYVDKVFVYTLRNHGTNLADREQNFGLLYYNFTAKPSLAVVQSAATACTAVSDTLESGDVVQPPVAS